MAIGVGRGSTRVGADRSGFRFRARAETATLEGIASSRVVEEFFNVAFKRFAKAMSVSEAEQSFSIVLRPLLAVHSSSALYFEGLRIADRHRMSWYDPVGLAHGGGGSAGPLRKAL
jgi:predicted nucleic acid-binding protein